MQDRYEKQTPIALLIIVAALAIVLGVLEALIDHPQATDATSPPPNSQFQRVDEALELNNVSVAVRTRHDLAARAKARDACLVALFATGPGGASAHWIGP